jgi:hypothetical protein
MGLYAKDKGGQDFPPIDPGTHHAVCYGVVDLGTHENPLFGTKGQKVWICWELPDQRIKYDKSGQHYEIARSISKIYTLSIHEKSNLGKDLVSWRGQQFTDAEKQGFDIFTILGANCLLQVVHQQKNGKTFANISTIAKLMKNMQKLKPENGMIQYSIEVNSFEIPDNVPDWVKKKIAQSEEHQGGFTKAEEAIDGENVEILSAENDDLPF